MAATTIKSSAAANALSPPSSDSIVQQPSTDKTALSATRNIVFIHSDAYFRALSRLPVHPQREEMTLALLKALSVQCAGSDSEVHRPLGMQFISPSLATDDELLRFHARDYVDMLRRTAQSPENCQQTTLRGSTRADASRHRRSLSHQDCEEFELVDDAYVFPGLFEYCRFVAGASLTAVDALKHLIQQWRRQNSTDSRTATAAAPLAINLGGGRHHAMRSQASGFCYVNDVVLAIQRLQTQSPTSNSIDRLERVLCIDIDVHHGDGVQEAFYYSSNVTTLSFHMLERAFFPGTGTQEEIGVGRGKHHTINVPLRRGIVDDQFHALFQTIVSKAVECVEPDVIVLVCGVDTLAKDGLGGFNLTSRGITRCVQTLLGWNRPLLLLGGGGYSGADACRALAAVVTAVAAPGVDVIDLEVPEHEFYEEYGPDFRMTTKAVLHRPNKNTEESLALVTELAVATLERAKRGRITREVSRQDLKRKRG